SRSGTGRGGGADQGARAAVPRAAARQRGPQGGVGFLCAGARPASAQEMSVFIDDHKARFGVAPICRALQIAPSTYYAVKTRQREPSARAQRDAELVVEIRRVYEQSKGLYGARKVWWQLRLDGIEVA